MISFIAGFLFFSTLGQAEEAAKASYKISIPQTTPGDAIAVPADFFGFGYESGLVPHYDNDFSDNVVKSIGSRMSKPLVIRIGGTSGDNIFFNASQTGATFCKSGPKCVDQSTDTFFIGPSYFDAFKRFQGATMTIQAPMGNDMEMNTTMAYVRPAWNALGQNRVAAIALGNEPNYYDYGASEYVSRALEIEAQITKEFQLEGDAAQIFQVGEIASQAVQSNKPYDLLDVFQAGINKNGRSKYAAEHFYQVSTRLDSYSPANLQTLLMNHTAIVDRLGPYASAVDYLRKNDDQLAFVVSETGSAIDSSPVSFGAGFGAALWAVDFHLAAMARGIQRVCNTQEPAATHSFWVPDNSGPNTAGPAVQGIFPAAAYITDFVGKADSLGKVTEIPVPGEALLSAYAMYGLQSDKPQRVALVNLHQWEAGSKVPRGSATITLQVGNDVKSAVVQRMHSESGSLARGFDLGGAQENVTWAGEQWSFRLDEGKGHFPSGHQEEEKLKVEDGTVVVSVPETEAVIVYLS